MTTAALVLVATPIGNMGDLSPRAADELARADVICCEDTRRTGRLLQLAGIDRRPLLMVNDHNEAQRRGEVLDRLGRGERVCVVTDAGMPGISDPGERLVAAAAGAGFRVEVVPGPSAGVAALVASGLPTGRWAFEGFLPRKGRQRTTRLEALAREERTTIVYEAPHRLSATLSQMAEVLGGSRRVAVARELTKLHEEVWRGGLADAAAWADETSPRGEVVIVVDGVEPRVGATDAELSEALRSLLGDGASTRDAATTLAKEFGVPKRRVYDLALSLDETGEPESP